MNKTKSVSQKDIKRQWWLVDATGVRLGKLGTIVASLLKGKHNPSFTPNVDCGDNVIVINSKDVDIHPAKPERKKYYHHTGYPGGIKEIRLKELLKQKPNEVVRKAIWGMMPNTKLGKKMYKKLYVYESSEHEHEAQKPKTFKVD
jgi:large subunit ribosomal protein L13